MRHKKKFNHLGRKRGHRHAMLSNMASSLILHKRIKTTTAKAKALKVFVEPLITKAKDDTTHSRRTVFSYLKDKEATSELFREVITRVGERPGGYTRIIKLDNRLGDNAEMCIIELVDFNENLLAEKASSTKSTRRRRGGKKTAAPATETAADVAVEDAPVEEAAAETPAEEVEAPETTATEAEEAPAAELEAPAEEAPADEVKEEAPEAKTEAPAAEPAEAEKKEEESDTEAKEDEKKSSSAEAADDKAE